jgi:hypothetical protein
VGSSLDDVINFFFFNLLKPSSCTMALKFAQPFTEISTRNLFFWGGIKAQPARKAENRHL